MRTPGEPELATGTEASRFDPMDAEALWSAGDRVVYEITSEIGSRRYRWEAALRLPVVPGLGFESDFLPPDPVSGRVMTRSAIHMYTAFKRQVACVIYRNPITPVQVTVTDKRNGEVFGSEVRTQGVAHLWQQSVTSGAGFGVVKLLNVMQRTKHLFQLLMEVVKPPSLASILRKFGSISLRAKLKTENLTVVSRVTPFGTLPTVWVPVRISANGEPALDCQFLVTWIRSPLLLSVGVLRIEARHPDDPRKLVVVRLIEAKRGSPGNARQSNDIGNPLVHAGMSRAETARLLQWEIIKETPRPMLDGRTVQIVRFAREPEAPARRKGPREKIKSYAAFDASGLLFLVNSNVVMTCYLNHQDRIANRATPPEVLAPYPFCVGR